MSPELRDCLKRELDQYGNEEWYHWFTIELSNALLIGENAEARGNAQVTNQSPGDGGEGENIR